MKSFKEYLTESKKTYTFKVKIAGDCPDNCTDAIKRALSEFEVATVSAGKRTPITASHTEFPNHKNIAVSLFDVITNYPATSRQVLDKIAEGLRIPATNILALTELEQQEVELNHANLDKSGQALLTKHELEDTPGAQKLVGEEHKLNFLKELSKTKHSPEQYTGVNDQLLAKSVPNAPKGK
jgi:hypothetical protein